MSIGRTESGCLDFVTQELDCQCKAFLVTTTFMAITLLVVGILAALGVGWRAPIAGYCLSGVGGVTLLILGAYFAKRLCTPKVRQPELSEMSMEHALRSLKVTSVEQLHALPRDQFNQLPWGELAADPTKMHQLFPDWNAPAELKYLIFCTQIRGRAKLGSADKCSHLISFFTPEVCKKIPIISDLKSFPDGDYVSHWDPKLLYPRFEETGSPFLIGRDARNRWVFLARFEVGSSSGILVIFQRRAIDPSIWVSQQLGGGLFGNQTEMDDFPLQEFLSGQEVDREINGYDHVYTLWKPTAKAT